MDTLVDMTPADELAAWCELDVKIFSQIYEGVTAGKDAAKWPELVAHSSAAPGAADPIKALMRSACREALKANILAELAVRVSQVQLALGKADAANADKIVQQVVSGLGGGRMQALVNAGGLKGRETLYGALAVDDATAIVYLRNQVTGTAFLVAPDLVLTAAHVVLQYNTEKFLPIISDGISFSFRVHESNARREAMIAYPATRNALVAHSLPWGNPPNELSVAPPEESRERLDFALVRLDRVVQHVRPLDITSPPRLTGAHDPLLVLGFPGGTAMGWDAGVVASVDSERLQHLVNTLPGMSGSCCIDVDGRPVALHEGSLANNTFSIGGHKGPKGANRAVCLWGIRNAMPTGPADPLLTRPKSPGLAFHDEALVRRWAKAGLRFAPRELQSEWTRYVRSAIGRGPEEAGSVPAFHPWFRRDTFEAWIDQSIVPTGRSYRLCIVSGGPGTGKSFLAAILRARVQDDLKDVVVISATETTAWSWREAIRKWGVDAAESGALRPDAGVAMHDDVPKAAERIAGFGGRKGEVSAPPLFVVIDFDGNASFPPDEEPPWLPFMRDLLGYPWVRLVVIGAPESVTSDLMDLTLGEEQDVSTRIRLEHLDHTDFQTFVKLLLRQWRDDSLDIKDALNKALASRARILQAFPAPHLQTTATVLAGIMLQRSLGS